MKPETRETIEKVGVGLGIALLVAVGAPIVIGLILALIGVFLSLWGLLAGAPIAFGVWGASWLIQWITPPWIEQIAQ